MERCKSWFSDWIPRVQKLDSIVGKSLAVQKYANLVDDHLEKMLKNALTLAIGGVATAENEPSKVSSFIPSQEI